MAQSPYQPIITLPKAIRACFSSATDGSAATGGGNSLTDENRRASEDFLQNNDFSSPETRVFVTYGPEQAYTDVVRVTNANIGRHISSDALYTTELRTTITLPVADCIATVVYDPIIGMMGVLHLGRHASVAGLIEVFAAEVRDNVASRPQNWHVWMSPSLQAAENRLDYFDPPHPEQWDGFVTRDESGILRVDIPGHNRARFEALGVISESIYVSSIDTYTDVRYFSHRAMTEKGDLSRQGRMMVAAEMIGQR